MLYITELKIKMMGLLFIRSLNKIYIVISIAITMLLFSCNFNITDNPGPQISSTIESSKKHNTFICAYKIDSNNINGIPIESIFAEKKYWLSKGFFGKFNINCCESQLIITFKDDNNIITLDGIPQNWEIIDFKPIHSKMLIRDYKSNLFPDTIQLKIIPDVKNKQIFETLNLYRIS